MARSLSPPSGKGERHENNSLSFRCSDSRFFDAAGEGSLSFLVFIRRLSTFLDLVLLRLTASFAAPSSKLTLCIARTLHESGASVSRDGARLLRGHGRIDCFALRSSKR